MDLLRWVVVLSSILAAMGLWRGSRWSRWQAFWPVPFMLFGMALAAADLSTLLNHRGSALSTTSLVLGVWAGFAINVIGLVEIAVSRHKRADGRTLFAPAVLLAMGAAMITSSLEIWPWSQAASTLPGLCVLASGALLMTARSLPSTSSSLRLGWPAALLLSAVPVPRQAVDPLVESRRELAVILDTLRRSGAQVMPIGHADSTQRKTGIPVESMLIDGNEVRFYLIAHEGDLSPEVHLSPPVRAPPPTGGVSHRHAGRHIVVVCATADTLFARRLETLVQRLRSP